jgi:hypothetical protein
MPATTYEKQPLVRFIGHAVTDPEETPSGKATKFRFAMADGYGDDAVTTFYDVVATKDPLREAIRQHVYKGTRLGIEGNEKVDSSYNPEKPQHSIFPSMIFLAQNIKTIVAKDEF